jgi:hypothetical protein
MKMGKEYFLKKEVLQVQGFPIQMKILFLQSRAHLRMETTLDLDNHQYFILNIISAQRHTQQNS